VGYNLNTFSTTRFNAATVDVNNTKAQGFKWYAWNMFGHTPAGNDLTLNGDGSITLQGATTGPNGEIVSIVPTNANSAGFWGTAFGGGGYFEATLTFDPATVNTANGWPSWWSFMVEGVISQQSGQWVGQAAGYIHNVENDFFEFDAGVSTKYGIALHESWGISGVTCTPGFCRQNSTTTTPVIVPVSTDFRVSHTYGMLWVPATPTTQGYSKYYFDWVQLGGQQVWTQFLNDGSLLPPPTGQPWAFGVIDTGHLLLILGTGVGQPMNVTAVNVWQASSANNLVS
jgi:hypothetical protein